MGKVVSSYHRYYIPYFLRFFSPPRHRYCYRYRSRKPHPAFSRAYFPHSVYPHLPISPIFPPIHLPSSPSPTSQNHPFYNLEPQTPKAPQISSSSSTTDILIPILVLKPPKKVDTNTQTIPIKN
ncbi:hypothetical protein OCU04_006401 [Sclerotinia nivalis]|uniref:Uncharacterized protein n=1 Tax=Sclerotinia nivalis TaxID=352851 RepID=A0A9X0DJC1_9HELO|nr:hypothetical protein OCU04_006401 [Sclerotinia nivalis]